MVYDPRIRILIQKGASCHDREYDDRHYKKKVPALPRYCGYEIPEGELYCGNCGKEVYAVPDYNPLEDMLSAQIKVGVSGKESADTDYLYDLSDDIKSVASSGRRTGRMLLLRRPRTADP